MKVVILILFLSSTSLLYFFLNQNIADSELKDLLKADYKNQKGLEASFKKIVDKEKALSVTKKMDSHSDFETIKETIGEDPEEAAENVKRIVLDESLDSDFRRKVLDAYYEDNQFKDKVLEVARFIVEDCPESSVLNRALDIVLAISENPELEVKKFRENIKDQQCIDILELELKSSIRNFNN